MATQAETLALIADNLDKIWEKLCEIQDAIDGGVVVEVPTFFNEFGDILLEHQITLVEGDISIPSVARGMTELNDIYTTFTQALTEYSNRFEEPWSERSPGPPPEPPPEPPP